MSEFKKKYTKTQQLHSMYDQNTWHFFSFIELNWLVNLE